MNWPTEIDGFQTADTAVGADAELIRAASLAVILNDIEASIDDFDRRHIMLTSSVPFMK